MATVDLPDLVSRLANRSKQRAEATVQSDVRTLLLYGGLNLGEDQVREINLETPAGDRRRIDVEAGLTVIEVKRDLRAGNVLPEAVEQLAGYVRSQTKRFEQRYTGVLTDGADWYLYHLEPDGRLREVSRQQVLPSAPDVDGLVVWLEAVLATGQDIAPTPREIARRLGATSPAHALDRASLAALYAQSKGDAEVALKRELWARLLTTAFGTQFVNDEALFVEHTYLVVVAEIIAHAAVEIDVVTTEPAALLDGREFSAAGIHGVVEADFFDWVISTPDGPAFVRSLARRLARFDWRAVEHDVLKVLYESVIDAEQRHRLGEYYTPDWLAEHIVNESVSDPLGQRVLDPSCGSGTFVFHAVRKYIAAADAAGHSNAEVVSGVTSHVYGMDVHPVAVTLARVTYLLALADRLGENRRAFAVPVYLGDSLQWQHNQSLLGSDRVTIYTSDGMALFDQELVFPASVVADVERFDQVVSALSDRATQRERGSKVPPIVAIFNRYRILDAEDRETLTQTFQTLCHLHDHHRNHIWGYYARNLARPLWLTGPEHQVDVLVGNPPWLAYRFMTAEMQGTFRARSTERGLWGGSKVATNQDLSGYFVVRAVELYLRAGGTFAFVMPLSALSRQQFKGFRTGDYGTTHVAFGEPWDLDKVSPPIFPVPCSVVVGTHAPQFAKPLTAVAQHWHGRLPSHRVAWDVAVKHLTTEEGAAAPVAGTESPYAARFSQGATVVPRVLHIVRDAPTGKLGLASGKHSIRSARSSLEKAPWKGLPDRSGAVEEPFVYDLHLGSTLLPFRLLVPEKAVVPWSGERLLSGLDSEIDEYPGLSEWWRAAEGLWNRYRSSGSKMTLLDRLNFQRTLSNQFPPPPHRVVYTASGATLAAARLSDPKAVVEHNLYWAAAASADEGRYLTAILNAAVVTERVGPLQSRGQFGARHFDKYVFTAAPAPFYNAADGLHVEIAREAERAEQVAMEVSLADGLDFKKGRRAVREALLADGVGARMEALVLRLLDGTPST